MERGAMALMLMLAAATAGALAPTVAAQTPPQPAMEEFVPIDELPSDDQLPAAPLVISAYAFAWVALFGYLWSIWRRLGRVEQELADLARMAAERPRSP